MKPVIKSAFKRLIAASVGVMGKTSAGRYLYRQVVQDAMSRTRTVTHGGVDLVFAVPNALNEFRVETFSTKEPETLEWIDGIPQGSVVWDVGANIGLYACYAAKARGCRVFAFEPSVFNLELLARNIYLNQLTEQVTIVPLPLCEETAVSKLNMTTTEWGGALSTFGQSYGHDGEPMQPSFEFPTVGLSIADAANLLKIPQPDYVKMDVDGIEHLILRGGLPVLRKVKGVSVEINDQFTSQADDANRYLKEAGLSFQEKRHAAQYDADAGAARHTFNQIWLREAIRQPGSETAQETPRCRT